MCEKGPRDISKPFTFTRYGETGCVRGREEGEKVLAGGLTERQANVIAQFKIAQRRLQGIVPPVDIFGEVT